MGRGVYTDRPEYVFIDEYPDRELKENEIRIDSEFSAIKHGTEFNLLSGKSPFSSMYFDGNMRMFIDKPEEEPKPYKSMMGNTTVGTVSEVGSKVKRFKVGDRVYAYGPIAERAIVPEYWTEMLEEPMTAQDAVCIDPAIYAFAAVRDSDAKAGDHVVLSGLGAIGMIAVQLLKLTGCLEIIVVDPFKKRREMALKMGATLALDPRDCDVGLEVHKYLGGKGADIAIEASGNYKALYEAMRSVQKCGRIVTLGYYKGKDTELTLGREWHHNRLSMISSMPTWDNPLRDHPLWTADRLAAALREMFKRKMLTSEGIVDPIVDFEQSAETIMNIYRNPQESIKLGVTYKK